MIPRPGLQALKLAQAHVTVKLELRPIPVEPLPESESTPCKVLECAVEGVDAGQPPEITAAKFAYLRACIRLSGLEVRLDRTTSDIAETKQQLEELTERQKKLEELAETAHTSVKELYRKLTDLLTADELTAYEAGIEPGNVSILAGNAGGDLDAIFHDPQAIDAEPPALESSAWRSRPTSDLDFSSVMGVGQKKIEAIVEACPTMGDLEDMRTGRRLGDRLTDIPGIGRKLADELEELILDWLTKNVDSGATGDRPRFSCEPKN